MATGPEIMQYDRDCKEYFLMFQTKSMVSRFFGHFHSISHPGIREHKMPLPAYLEITSAVEHGQDDTHCQCVCETFYGTGSHDTQHESLRSRL